MADAKRQRMLIAGLSNKDSALYKGMCKVLLECEAAEQRSRMVKPFVVVPFFLDSADVVALEQQFSVVIKQRRGALRARLSPRVAGLVFLLDDALVEHAGGSGRNMLLIDGDVMTVSALGAEGRVVERTQATARLSTGYFFEDEQLRSYSSTRDGNVNCVAEVFLTEQRIGGGDHYWPRIREDGPRVSSIVVNHFKTPVGPRQLAWLAYKRGAVVYGALFFQPNMLTDSKGDLKCFPGQFYIDRDNDVITLVPSADATMSISHPYSSWRDIICNNVVVAGGHEYLCEKYKTLDGVLYYTMSPVGSDFEVSEELRTSYFDTSSVGVTELRYPVIRLSEQGVPVGHGRGVSRILTARFEQALSRLMDSASDVVTPQEAFTVLMDYNNTVVMSLDSVAVADRMDFPEQNGAAMALALHVNWSRHAAKGTFNTLMSAIKARHGVSDAPLHKLVMSAVAAWWARPDSFGEELDGLPETKVVDWCGNDFSVVVRDVDPWIEITQTAGLGKESSGREFPWFPRVGRAAGWIGDLVDRARLALSAKTEVNPDAGRVVACASASRFPTRDQGCDVESVGRVSLVNDTFRDVQRPLHELTEGKKKLVTKLCAEQSAVDEMVPIREYQFREDESSMGVGVVPVPDVDPIAAIRADILMVNNGPFQRDIAATGYRIAEVDIHKTTDGSLLINDAKRLIPAPRWVRDPLVEAGVEGKRIVSQAALLGAIFKRNVGVPANRGSVDLDSFCKLAVKRVIQACYRSDWQEVVQKHLGAGMWQPNVADVDDLVAIMDEKKVKRLLSEFFSESTIDLERWLLMAKGKIKTSRDVGAEMKVDHSQTILYQENGSTNAFYSAQTRRFKECIDECLRPEVSLNPQRSDEEHERWYNSLDSHRRSFQKTYSYASDIRTFDRAQEHVALRVDIEWYRCHGLDERTLAKWEEAHGTKRAAAMMFGVVLKMVLGGISGDWKTLMRNGIVNLAAVIVSADIRRNDIVMLDIKGDDMDAEFSRTIRVEQAIERMSLSFNLSAKVFSNDVRYMCKSFRIRKGGRWYFVADPWARAQTVCTPMHIGNHEDNMDERWMSVRADLRHYDNGILVDAVAEAAQQLYSTSRPLYGFARGLSVLAGDKNKYISFFGPPRRVS